MGEYNPNTEYLKLDILQYEGSSYIVRKACQGITPADGEYYMLAAEKGDTGEQGAQGIQGEVGRGLTIIDYYDTVQDLQNDVTNPKPGDAYGIGTEKPYQVYIYSETKGWINNGELEGIPGEKGETGDSGVYIGTTAPSNPDVNVWINPDGEGNGSVSGGGRSEIYIGDTAPTDPYIKIWINPDGSIGGGTNDHTKLVNRDAGNQHPIEAISGLQEISETEVLDIYNNA